MSRSDHDNSTVSLEPAVFLPPDLQHFLWILTWLRLFPCPWSAAENGSHVSNLVPEALRSSIQVRTAELVAATAAVTDWPKHTLKPWRLFHLFFFFFLLNKFTQVCLKKKKICFGLVIKPGKYSNIFLQSRYLYWASSSFCELTASLHLIYHLLGVQIEEMQLLTAGPCDWAIPPTAVQRTPQMKRVAARLRIYRRFVTSLVLCAQPQLRHYLIISSEL